MMTTVKLGQTLSLVNDCG